jgi:hypothetical protein
VERLKSEREIIVVSGTPRSGTSLMMQMLEAAGVPILCDRRRPPDASNLRGYYELEAVKATRRDSGWVSRAPGRAVKVIHALLGDLPADRRYRVIWMERDPAEVVASQNRMLARLGEQGASAGGPSEDRLIEIQRDQAAHARALLSAAPHFEWIAVGHRSLVLDPQPVAVRIARFLGIEDRASDLASAVAPELYRERRG